MRRPVCVPAEEQHDKHTLRIGLHLNYHPKEGVRAGRGSYCTKVCLAPARWRPCAELSIFGEIKVIVFTCIYLGTNEQVGSFSQ